MPWGSSVCFNDVLAYTLVLIAIGWQGLTATTLLQSDGRA